MDSRFARRFRGTFEKGFNLNVKECRVLTCVYCGHEYPQGTPASGDNVLTDHIQQCEKHPMKKLRDDYAALRKALVGLVGADDPQELQVMEATIRVIPVPDIDRMNTINAIQALLQTQDKRDSA